ncbi:MAG: hypothetical protein WB774_06310 [Xanthobacteraceae bacterium]
MKLTTLTVAFAAVTVLAQSAQAHEHHHRVYHHVARSHRDASYGGYGFSGQQYNAEPQRTASYGVGPRPSAWCGWEMRQLVGGDPGPSYNLARNWAHWGRSGPAGVGAVVVWPRHVGKIIGQENGEWVIQSGNDGHALRSRARSIVGAIAIRWG